MRLFSFLKRTPGADAPPKKAGKAGARSSSADDVQALRVRARRRLIGAAVLVAVGVIGFPLIFETQPRPMPVDLPIEIPRKDNAPPLEVPAREPQTGNADASNAAARASDAQALARSSVPVPVPVPVPTEPVSKAVEPAPEKATEKAPEKAPEKAAEKAPDKAPAKTAEKPVDKAAGKASDKPVERSHDKPKVAEKPAEKPADKAPIKSAAPRDGARAQALLEGREPVAAAAPTARYIVQVGAYGENKAAQDVRNKVEKLGLKTYAQAVETPDGRRVRVRLGPFASREEAERAAAKLKGAGLSGAILTL